MVPRIVIRGKVEKVWVIIDKQAPPLTPLLGRSLQIIVATRSNGVTKSLEAAPLLLASKLSS